MTEQVKIKEDEDYLTPEEFQDLLLAIDNFHETIYKSDQLKWEVIEALGKTRLIHSTCIIALTVFNAFFFYILVTKGLL